ncbi:TerD family protein [Nocardia inohanensis]|uniref:TerD family protein n=1 Tax=Nocardia inohanensis TaxID=209246 RepID=UPI000831E801|nr:TerD family protein [Nocardia inohanensis]
MQGNSWVGGIGLETVTVVDVETSGLSSGTDRVLSVAALRLDAAGGVAEEFYSLVDPGCDPGPVHVHGLTREKLRGAPDFGAVRGRLAGLLEGRVMVAHNARFDYDFLAGEFRRSGAVLPVSSRLCTLALARRVAPPTADYKLGSLAAHYGIAQLRAHDALDDTRVLVGVLRGLIGDAAWLGVPPPLLDCPPKDANRHLWRGKAKAPCAFAYPGRFEERGALIQGMKVAFSGETGMDRNELVDRAEAAGLDVTGNVSRLTSLLVTNRPASSSNKAGKARQHGTPVVDEARFLELLAAIQPGVRKGDAGQRVPSPGRAMESTPAGPLNGRRVLVLGGTHRQAAEIRRRITELGGSSAVNMSAGVTDVLALPGAENDQRWKKAADIGLPIWGLELLEAAGEPDAPRGQAPAMHSTPGDGPREPIVLSRGQVVDLPVATHGAQWSVRAGWPQHGAAEVDLVAFLVDENDRVAADSDFVFYNQPETRGARLTVDGPSEQGVSVDLEDLPGHCRRIVIAAALGDPERRFGDVGPIEIEVDPGPESGTFARATLDAATEERTLLLAELYPRDEDWRLRAVGQGYPTGLAALARHYGVEVDD